MEKDGNFVFAVWNGNFPNVIRRIAKLRKDKMGQEIWTETQPENEKIDEMDLVWRPVNFQTRSRFEMLQKRC